MSTEFVNAASVVSRSCAGGGHGFTHADFNRWGLRGVTLRPYQLDGVSWLAERLTGGGCILGDEMGLGKTLQVIRSSMQSADSLH